jgi:hypothetical protein
MRRRRRRLSKKERKFLLISVGIIYLISLVSKHIDLIMKVLLIVLSISAILLLLYIFAKYNKLLPASVNKKIIDFIDFINPFWRKQRAYKKTDYYAQTHISYKALQSDPGRLGEYKIFDTLFSYNDTRKFLFNCYIPKDDGETTEIDVIMIHNSGIYVFESKNYSGWIFGNEIQQEWTQTLIAGRNKSEKNHFFNPIMQNNLHIKWLSKYINDETIKYHSYIVFGKNCELKDINVTSHKHHILPITDLLFDVSKQFVPYEGNLSSEQIDDIYNRLYPLTQVSQQSKDKHIEDIIKNH